MNIESVEFLKGMLPDLHDGHTLFVCYIIGAIVVGLPMALLSLWCYWLEEELDYRKIFWPLKMVRNFLHPGSFLFLPDCEHRARRNYHFCYEGPISDLDRFGDGPGPVLYYIIVSMLFWPVRLLISFCAVGVWIALILIALPFYLLSLLCQLICWPFRK